MAKDFLNYPNSDTPRANRYKARNLYLLAPFTLHQLPLVLSCWISLFFILFSVGCGQTSVQQSPTGQDDITVGAGLYNNFAVKYVGAISTPADLENRPWFGARVFNFIFGEGTNRFSRPIAMATDEDGRLIVVDQGARNLIRVDNSRGKFQPLIDNDNGDLPSMVGITRFDGDKFLYSDSSDNAIYLLVRDGRQPSKFEVKTDLHQPTSIAWDPTRQHLWIADTAAHRLLILDKDGNLLTTIGKRGTKSGEFNFPTSIWLDQQGNAHVVDSLNYRLQILDCDGKFISSFGQAGDGTGYFARPKGVATDSFGHIFIVDSLFNAVQIFDKAGNFLYSFGKQGRGPGEFWLPAGISINEKNRIFVADSYNSRVQIFDLVRGEVQ